MYSFYNEDDFLPRSATVCQQICIKITYLDDYTDDDIYDMTEKIAQVISENKDIVKPIYDLRDYCNDDSVESDYDEVYVYAAAYANISPIGSDQDDDAEVYDKDEMPGYQQDFKGKEDMVNSVFKNLKIAGFKDIVKIDIYGTEIEDVDYLDNID